MNAKQRNEVRALTLRGVLALSGAAALWCAMTVPSLAQVEPTKAQSAPPARSMAAVNENVSSTEQKPAAPVAGEKNGQHEGITVHGHWIIDVKNPDGKVTKHVEFENSIASGGIMLTSNGGAISVAGGNAFLSALLAGQVASPAGSWAIFLEGSGGLDSTDGPCAANLFASCILMQNSPNNFLASSDCTPSIVAGVSCNLSITPLGVSPNLSGFQLSGSIAPTQNGEVSTVATAVLSACGTPNALVANCALTAANGMAFFTSRSDFPGAPLAVAAGQTLAVTVQISFQ